MFSGKADTRPNLARRATAEGLATFALVFAGCGALVVPEQKAEFAGAVVKVLQDARLRDELRIRGRAYAQTWSSRVLAQRLADLYGSVIGDFPTVGAQRHAADSRRVDNPKLEREFFCAKLPAVSHDGSGSPHGSEARVDR